MMELGLSLGDSSRPNFIGLMEKGSEGSSNNQQLGLGFNTTLSIGPIITVQRDQQEEEEEEEEEAKAKKENSNNQRSEDHHEASNNGFHQLDLLPKLSFPWHPPSQNGTVLSSDIGANYSRGLDVNVLPVATVAAAAEEDGEALSSSPSASSFQMELCMYSRGGSGSGKRENSDGEAYEQSCHQRVSDEDDNGGNTRKKLRLSKEQSAFLEESFKEHHTLNPKQKLALARQLNLRPRQVEVWFQNRRARTKLKQTEVDCEYLKRCCETLTEENRRLHKELQELRALKSTSNSNPFYMQLPATTLTMCPSCERVATNNSTSTITTTTSTSISNIAPTPKTLNNGNENSNSNSKAIGFPFGNKPIFHPFGNSTSQPQPHQSTPS